MKEYDVIIERGHTEICDYCFDYIKDKIWGKWLDVGTNTGALLDMATYGVGIEKSKVLVEIARRKGRNVMQGDGEELPFKDGEFQTVVLLNVLEQCHDWKKLLSEAIRVSNTRVIGINPIPGRSPWGVINGWVKSLITPAKMIDAAGECERFSYRPLRFGKYYFEIYKKK